MEIRSQENNLCIGEKCYSFKYNVKNFVVFPSIIILMFGEKDKVLKNNVVAIDYNAMEKWNISDIIKFNYAEAYVELSKENENIISVITYHGVKFYIDIDEQQIVKKTVTK